MGWLSSRWARNTVIAVAGAGAVYGMICLDVMSRARESFLEGDKYMQWHEHPEMKKAFFDKMYEESKAELDKSLANKKISDGAYKQELEALAFDRDFAINESSLKYAYQWYKDTYELFSPPESKWVKLARQKSPEVLALWKKELSDQKIPFEETMFE